MKKPPHKISRVGSSAEYDFSAGVRGKYSRGYAEGANVVLLEPDVAKAFPTAKSVNRSLRGLIGAARPRRQLIVKG
jgi:hypothetical protein